jgi:ABC-2 type transport system permease protein
MFSRLRQMLIKEFIQVLRDKRTRFVLIIPPLVQLLVFGYAANFEIHHVPIAVLDFDNTQESRDLLSRFASSPYFTVRARLGDPDDIHRLIDRSEVVVALQIHAGFAEDLRKGRTATVQAILDGTNSNTALVALGYISQIGQAFARSYQADRLSRTAPLLIEQVPQIQLERRPLFNTDLRSQWFFVPGVIGSLTLLIVVLLTAFAVVREREIGTLEQIMVTPIRRSEFVLGKTLPFFLVGLFDAALIGLLGTLWFGIPFRGSLGVLALGLVVFLLCTLGIGLFVSTISATQQQAMVSAFFFLMPAITFSGFGFPISSMPEAMQWLTYADPLRYFLIVLRGVYLKGIGLAILWPQIAAMGGIAALMLTISVFRFRKVLD